MCIKIEDCRLKWIRITRRRYVLIYMKALSDSIIVGETRACAIGTTIVLTWSFQGGYRDMKQRHMDTMALVQMYGKADDDDLQPKLVGDTGCAAFRPNPAGPTRYCGPAV